MTYRVIALDLDGTLLDRQKRILPESLAVLTEARAQGVKVIVVTGRHHVAIHPFYQALQLDTRPSAATVLICTIIRRAKSSPLTRLIKSKPKKVVDLLEQHGIHGLLYVDDAMLYQHLNGHVSRSIVWGEALPEGQRPNIVKVDSLRDAADQANSVWKFATSHEDLDALRAFAKQVEDDLGLACEWSWHDQVDVAKQGNSKGRRLQEWVESQGMSMADVIAFGDNYNDLSMLENVGLGVAMGNADDAIKQRAGLVIADNEQPGIAEVIRAKVLG
ncbi:pyridoxal phosphate (PLP) phosphatase [Ewingella americana]|uniref:Pyridoxal phosphate (PLP) phosphatase n=1 Tax=Ewingella americana TaxID=41202 RepID=A0A377NF02_9GAMM|nr:pyridoxal phosphate (PLP) phosphatase [Ewingella americana]